MALQHRLIAVALLCFAGAALTFTACSNQGEGERCDHFGDNAGNDECQDGLACTPAGNLNGNPGTDICCPVNRSQATTFVCQVPPNPGNGDAAPPAESGVAADVSVDGPAADTSTPASDAGDAGDAATTIADAADGG